MTSRGTPSRKSAESFCVQSRRSQGPKMAASGFTRKSQLNVQLSRSGDKPAVSGQGRDVTTSQPTRASRTEKTPSHPPLNKAYSSPTESESVSSPQTPERPIRSTSNMDKPHRSELQDGNSRGSASPASSHSPTPSPSRSDARAAGRLIMTSSEFKRRNSCKPDLMRTDDNTISSSNNITHEKTPSNRTASSLTGTARRSSGSQRVSIVHNLQARSPDILETEPSPGNVTLISQTIPVETVAELTSPSREIQHMGEEPQQFVRLHNPLRRSLPVMGRNRGKLPIITSVHRLSESNIRPSLLPNTPRNARNSDPLSETADCDDTGDWSEEEAEVGLFRRSQSLRVSDLILRFDPMKYKNKNSETPTCTGTLEDGSKPDPSDKNSTSGTPMQNNTSYKITSNNDSSSKKTHSFMESVNDSSSSTNNNNDNNNNSSNNNNMSSPSKHSHDKSPAVLDKQSSFKPTAINKKPNTDMTREIRNSDGISGDENRSQSENSNESPGRLDKTHTASRENQEKADLYSFEGVRNRRRLFEAAIERHAQSIPTSKTRNRNVRKRREKETIENPKETIENPKETTENPKETIKNPKETIGNPTETIKEPKETLSHRRVTDKTASTDMENSDGSSTKPGTELSEIGLPMGFNSIRESHDNSRSAMSPQREPENERYLERDKALLTQSVDFLPTRQDLLRKTPKTTGDMLQSETVSEKINTNADNSPDTEQNCFLIISDNYTSTRAQTNPQYLKASSCQSVEFIDSTGKRDLSDDRITYLQNIHETQSSKESHLKITGTDSAQEETRDESFEETQDNEYGVKTLTVSDSESIESLPDKPAETDSEHFSSTIKTEEEEEKGEEKLKTIGHYTEEMAVEGRNDIGTQSSCTLAIVEQTTADPVHNKLEINDVRDSQMCSVIFHEKTGNGLQPSIKNGLSAIPDRTGEHVTAEDIMHSPHVHFEMSSPDGQDGMPRKLTASEDHRSIAIEAETEAAPEVFEDAQESYGTEGSNVDLDSNVTARDRIHSSLDQLRSELRTLREQDLSLLKQLIAISEAIQRVQRYKSLRVSKSLSFSSGGLHSLRHHQHHPHHPNSLGFQRHNLNDTDNAIRTSRFYSNGYDQHRSCRDQPGRIPHSSSSNSSSGYSNGDSSDNYSNAATTTATINNNNNNNNNNINNGSGSPNVFHEHRPFNGSLGNFAVLHRQLSSPSAVEARRQNWLLGGSFRSSTDSSLSSFDFTSDLPSPNELEESSGSLPSLFASSPAIAQTPPRSHSTSVVGMNGALRMPELNLENDVTENESQSYEEILWRNVRLWKKNRQQNSSLADQVTCLH